MLTVPKTRLVPVGATAPVRCCCGWKEPVQRLVGSDDWLAPPDAQPVAATPRSAAAGREKTRMIPSRDCGDPGPGGPVGYPANMPARVALRQSGLCGIRACRSP